MRLNLFSRGGLVTVSMVFALVGCSSVNLDEQPAAGLTPQVILARLPQSHGAASACGSTTDRQLPLLLPPRSRWSNERAHGSARFP